MLWQCPTDPVCALVLAHGAGAGMRHASMEAIAAAFAQRGIATLRFDFPFRGEKGARVDSRAVATQAIESAYAEASRRTTLPIWVGGHSFGGRMASHAVLERAVPAAGLVFCSFPLHAPGKPGTKRAAHLPQIRQPMLFLSGTRDELAQRELLEPLVASLPTAKLHWLDTVDHGYRVLKRQRSRRDSVFEEMAEAARDFIDAQRS